MAEDLLKKYTFAVDSVKATNGKPMAVAFSQGDVKTAILIINLTENDTALDLTGKKVRVSFKKSDGTSVMQDMTTGISILDAAAGKIQIELRTQALSARGNVRGQISITDETAGLVAETAEFTFVVRESIINTSIVSSDELPIIEEMIEASAVLGEVDLQTVVNNTQNVNSVKSEVETARGASANLSGRFSSIDTQLASKATQKELNLRNYIRYGKINLPSDFFHNIDFLLCRDIDGKIKHNFDANNITSGYSVFYVSETGAAGNNGTSEGTPWQTLNYAIDQIEANPAVTSAKIVVLTNLSRSKAQINSKNLTKNYCIEGKAGTTPILATSEPNLSWTADGASFKATRSSVSGVFDNKYKIEYGIPARYVNKTSKAECDTTKGSWYTDGTSIWVNTLDGRIPDSDIYPCLNVTLWKAIMVADKKFMIRNIIGLNGSAGQAFNIYSLGNIGHVIFDNVKFINSQSITENSVEIKGIKYSWSFNVISAYGGRDGLNYHTALADAGLQTFVFEYNCTSFEHGLTDAVNFNNNCSTAHDGMRVLRIGTIGYKSKGPVIADVNGCYSILMDCVAHDSLINTGRSTKVSYYFDDAVSSLVTAPNGKAVLINCQGGGDVTWAISGDTSFKNGKIQVLNFIGQSFPTDLNLTLLNEVTQ